MERLRQLRTFIQQRLAQTTDTEAEQAIKIRLTIGFMVLLYFVVPWSGTQSWQESIFSLPVLVTSLYYLGALGIAVGIILRPKPSPIRRMIAIALDLSSLSVLMFYAGEMSVFLFVLYLWVILGNGFRYGPGYLHLSMAVAIPGFVIAITGGSYWQQPEHQPFGWSLLFLLILIPLYSAFLIKKLHVAITTAKQANEAKSRFLANMSHELRTPLNGVTGVADLLSETRLNQHQHDLVQIMRSSANTLLDLIENVLDISKIEAGKIIIRHEDFDLHQLIHSIMQMQRPAANSKQLSLQCHIDASCPYQLRGDPQHLKQVLINLLSNAIKFTDTGEVKLLVSLSDNHQASAHVRFEIIDTGIGIPESALDRIFDDFTQVGTAGANRTAGTGLGTTISRQLVHLMDGEIGVSSELGKGSRFWFECPFEIVNKEVPTLPPQKILVLAGNDIHSPLEQTLSEWQLQPQIVSSMTTALSVLLDASTQASPYMALLVDTNCLRDTSPAEFSRMLHAEPALHSLSMVLLNHESPITAVDSGFISVVPDIQFKPQLFNAVHAALGATAPAEANVIPLSERFARAADKPPLHVLIVEDNRVNQQVLSGILAQAGHQPVIAASGEDAFDLAGSAQTPFDIIIMDMNMPDYSGIEVMQTLRFMDTSSQTPVIMLTADATPEARERAENAGVDAFMTKPVNSAALLQQIAALQPETTTITPETRTVQRADIEAEWVDTQVLDDLAQLGSQQNFLASLIEGFKQDSYHHLQHLQSAKHDDYLQLRESLHALKGSATEMGARRLATLCQQAETVKPDELSVGRGIELTDDIENALDQTITALHAYLQQHPQQA